MIDRKVEKRLRNLGFGVSTMFVDQFEGQGDNALTGIMVEEAFVHEPKYYVTLPDMNVWNDKAKILEILKGYNHEIGPDDVCPVARVHTDKVVDFCLVVLRAQVEDRS